jgi:hypothetical protein
MSFSIKRPLSPSERILVKRLEKAEAIAASYVGDNILLRAKIRNMIAGTGWKMQLARWLICWDERTRFVTPKKEQADQSANTDSRPAPSE